MADLRSIDKAGVDKVRDVAQNKNIENDGGTEMTNTTSIKNVMYIHPDMGNGRECNTIVRLSIEASQSFKQNGRYFLPCDDCGKKLWGRPVVGMNSGKVKECHPRCTGAVGPSCDCPCEGENHGGKFNRN